MQGLLTMDSAPVLSEQHRTVAGGPGNYTTTHEECKPTVDLAQSVSPAKWALENDMKQ